MQKVLKESKIIYSMSFRNLGSISIAIIAFDWPGPVRRSLRVTFEGLLKSIAQSKHVRIRKPLQSEAISFCLNMPRSYGCTDVHFEQY